MVISNDWDNRTRFVVYGQAFLFVLVWAMALNRLIEGKFWNAEHSVKTFEAILSSDEQDDNENQPPKQMIHFIKAAGMSYYTTRYVWFFPHIVGSLIWWNFYFLQLIPSIRRKYKKFHRVLGRILMVCAVAQTVSGVGLAYMGDSPTIKIISYLLAVSIIYCVYHAWYYAAIEKDIAKHKYWAMRLVGYSQMIALQRVFMAVLMITHQFGWLGLYPPYDENDAATIGQIFDDAFVCSYTVAMMLTEWYLAGYYGWTETETSSTKAKAIFNKIE